MRIRGAILATTVLATPVAATAQPITGLYIGAGGGPHDPRNLHVTPTPRFSTGRMELNEGYGFNADLAVGYGLGNGFRFEIEGDFARSSLRKVQGLPPTTAVGTVRTWGVMANALFDLDVGAPWIFPYLGVGAGYQWTGFNPVGAAGTTVAFGALAKHGAPAGQAIVGASFPVPYVPGLSITADYRFMDILGGGKVPAVVATRAAVAPASLELHNQFNQDIVIGVRYAFNTPAPAAPPTAPIPVAAPAPAPARSYLVFFDWDKATLTERAKSIVKEAAENSTHVQVTRIEVNGYTDSSGGPRYNQTLSVRRAQAVAAELVRDGVPRNVIATQGFGETHLLVATAPNAREPQNRRVEIIIH